MSEQQTPPKRVNSLSEIGSLFQAQTPAPAHGNLSDTYDVVALMMYLIGVDESRLKDHVPTLEPHYKAYQKNPAARLIRNLCILRTALMKNFSSISRAFRYDLKNLSTLPEYIPAQVVMELEQENIRIQNTKPDVTNYEIAINRELANRLNNVRTLFPEWIKWDYIRPLFIMPNGLKTDGVREAGHYYNSDRNRYPFQCYMNWEQNGMGNILNSDLKFVTVLYEANGDRFEDKSLVTDAGDALKDDLHEFIQNHRRVLVVVDCENSDPIKLAAALSSLSLSYKANIHKLMFFDSDYTTAAWTTLRQTGLTQEFETEHIVVERLYEHKNQVDMALAINTSREVYTDEVDAVILASSDSDYWTLIQALPNIDFLVMLEKMKSGQTIRDALEKAGYHYCFIDDFCTGASYAIKTKTVLSLLQKKLEETVHLNVRALLEEVISSSWLEMTEQEKENFYDRYLKGLRISVAADGTVRWVVGG